MQFEGKQPLGVIYNTSMNRPDAALALAVLYALTAKRDARPGSVCVNGAGFAAAVYCDIVARFYTPGPPRNANQVLPTGLADLDHLPPDPPMVKGVVDRTEYPRSIAKLTDTSLAEAVLRNGVIFNREAVMILSAPATVLARTLDLQGAKDLYKQRVKMLVIVDSGAKQDVPALRRILSEWTTPVILLPKDLGETLRFPATAIEKDFAWAPAHPVADAYRAYQPMPYDAPSWDMAAILHAVRPDQTFDTEPGTIRISDDGRLGFTTGAGPHKALKLDPAKKDKVLQTLIELASAKPAQPQPRNRPPQAAADKKK